jgi:hypothetical protein
MPMFLQCFGTFDDEKYRDTGIDQSWRLWLFQVCTEWGYFTVRISFSCILIAIDESIFSQTAPPDQNMARIVSKLLTLGYESKICKQVRLSDIAAISHELIDYM